MKAENRAVGRCYCGAVRFVIDLPVKFCIHCHCPTCREAHGAALVTWVGVGIESFKVADQKKVRWYQYTEHSRRGFCPTCGSPMFYMSTRFPGDIHVTRASLLGEVDVTPKLHIFFDQHVDWFPFEDKLPRMGRPEALE